MQKHINRSIVLTVGSFGVYALATWLHTDPLLLDPALRGMAKLAANAAILGELCGVAVLVCAYATARLEG